MKIDHTKITPQNNPNNPNPSFEILNEGVLKKTYQVSTKINTDFCHNDNDDLDAAPTPCEMESGACPEDGRPCDIEGGIGIFI